MVSFDSADSSAFATTLSITGLRPGDVATATAIDTRPATGEFYALAEAQTGSITNLYTINTVTGAATFVATSSIPLGGASTDIAFDPVTDTIHAVNNSGPNLSINPVTGAAVADGALAYAAADPHAGALPFVGAIAYTNQDQTHSAFRPRPLQSQRPCCCSASRGCWSCAAIGPVAPDRRRRRTGRAKAPPR